MTQLDWIDQSQQRLASACARLQQLVEKERNSYRCEDYRRRREAAKKGRRVVA